MQRIKKILTSRIVVVAILILLEFFLLLGFVLSFAQIRLINTCLVILSYLIVIYVINKQENPSYKIAWIVLILIVPLVGGILYMILGGHKMPKKLRNGTNRVTQGQHALLVQDQEVIEELKEADENIAKIFHFALLSSDYPIYKNNRITYCASGEEKFAYMLEELKKAEHFIFLEYFIIDDNYMWNTILAILKEKVAQGVEVKLIYDDFGCITTLPRNYDVKMNKLGIETYRFNHLRPALVVQMNNRDHRKICVIDNKVGFVGGVNLADEYINRINRFGHWKDTAIRIEGSAVWSLTTMFLGMYAYVSNNENIDWKKYKLEAPVYKNDSFIQPYSDTPTDNEDVGMDMHLNIINHARKYIYIHTPYLIINNEIMTALCLASKNGVDVRITVPHIPDKWYVFQITQHNYVPLLEAGVKIYEYTPGFIHSKSIVSDDEVAICGTCNTDYRSYYLHFECGALFYRSECIKKMREDFEETMRVSSLVSLEDCKKVHLITRVFRAILNIFAPLF